MGDFLIKMHINKMDPKIRKKQADQLAIQGLFLLLVGSPLTGLGFSSPRIEKEQGQNCSGAALRPDPTHCLPLSQPCPAQ